MIALGVLLLAAAGTYFLLSRSNKSTLDDLNASSSSPPTMPQLPPGQVELHGVLTNDGAFHPIKAVVKDINEDTEDGANSVEQVSPSTVPPPSPALAAQATVETPSTTASVAPTAPENTDEGESVLISEAVSLIASYNSLYPGYQMHPKYWDRPLSAGSAPYSYGVVRRPDGFIRLSASDGVPKGTAPDAAQIRIPSIGVDSEVANLAIIDLGDSSQYETPKHVVGRIPRASNPGEVGNTWLFGHLESPIKGEGNVFRRLPEIPSLLNAGDDVYVSILNEDGDEYLYHVTETEVVNQDDLVLYETDDPTITLVACVPRLVYDHRILVTAKLVGVKRAG